MADDFSYDLVAYQSNFQPQMHPDKLATPARLLGMNPAAVNGCRYLELGCGAGDNLLNAAFTLPESRFVGVDLSLRHVEAARAAAAELDLRNVEFLHCDLTTLSRAAHGEFDYIAAHGLFSWVPDAVREKILALYGEMLAAHGVGYISFNALPGGRLRQMTREMMRYHTAQEAASLEKVEKGVAFLNFLRDSIVGNEYYRTILKNEIGFVTNHIPSSILHDELSDENQPFYFHEFAARAARHDLQYLCDSEYYLMPLDVFPPKTREVLESYGGDLIRREQYADFLLCRRFRQTLVCRAEIILERDVEPARLSEFYIASTMRPVDENAELETNRIEKFTAPNIAAVELDHPLTKLVLAHLGSVWTDAVKFDDLIGEARRRLEARGAPIESWDKALDITRHILLELYKNKTVELRTFRPASARVAGETPRASRLAQWQARRGSDVTTLDNTDLEIGNSFIRRVLLLADGTRRRLDLRKELRKSIAAGEFNDYMEKNKLLSDLPALLDEALTRLAEAGLLVA